MTSPPDAADLVALACIFSACLVGVIVAVVVLARKRAVPPAVGVTLRETLLFRDR